MINLKNITLRRGKKVLLEHANLTLFDQQKVGIVGANGCGKSTLFQCLLGQLSVDDGQIDISPKLEIAHLKQETPGVEDPALEYALQGDKEYTRIKQQMEEIESQGDGMAIATIHAQFAQIDGYSAPSRAAVILNGLGFCEAQLHWSVKDFSGGWRMRLNLAQVLLSRADIMLLDEPTNHLDLEGIVWLGEWIKSAKCLTVIISHDREFLDDIATHIVQLKNLQLKLYTGNYSTYEKEYATSLTVQEAAYRKQQAQRAHLQKFIDRFGAKATKAKQAQSRVKMLERMELVEQVRRENPFRFEFADNVCGVNPMLTMDHLSVGYEEKIVLNDVNFSLSDGDRIGLLGLNGAGKSTLIKLLAGDLSVCAGKLNASGKMIVGYFAQHQLELLDSDEDLLWHMRNLDPNIAEGKARTHLGGFNFSGDKVYDKIRSLSGGEKARLVLALLVWQKPNLLLMDEPTNHLDMEMREALMLALQNYQGALVLVSHDRYLLNCLVNEFWLIDDGHVQVFEGDLNDYRLWVKNKDELHHRPQETKSVKITQPVIDHKKIEKELHKLETKLTELTHQKTQLEKSMANSDLYQPERQKDLLDLQNQHNALIIELSSIESRLLELYSQS